jgi:hypothetical protein
LIRAIEPGLAPSVSTISLGKPRGMEDQTAHFIRDFIPSKALPTFAPACTSTDFATMRLRTAGITLNRLGRQGMPQSVLGHWSYAQSVPESLPLPSAP